MRSVSDPFGVGVSFLCAVRATHQSAQERLFLLKLLGGFAGGHLTKQQVRLATVPKPATSWLVKGRTLGVAGLPGANRSQDSRCAC